MVLCLFRAWKRGQFCPECNVVFGKESTPDPEYANCWVCSRQHHASCVGQATFICAQCQRRTQERCVGGSAAGNSTMGDMAAGADRAGLGGGSTVILGAGGTPIGTRTSSRRSGLMAN